MNRRKFIVTTVTGMVSLYLSPLSARSAITGRSAIRTARDLRTLRLPQDYKQNDHFLVVIGTNMSAGLDCTLGLDPQLRRTGSDERDMFIEYRPNEIVRASGLVLAPAAVPLVPHADSCAIVNGIFMRRDSGHAQLLEYMQSGDPTGTRATLPLEYASQMAVSPLGTLFNTQSVKQGERDAILTRLSSIENQMNGAASGGDGMDELAGLSGYSLQSLVNADKAVKQGERLMPEFSRVVRSFPGNEIFETKALAAAFSLGASTQALIQINTQDSLDTHSNHEKAHLKAQTSYWQQVADLFAFFKKVPYGKGSLFDATTFYVNSEFSRTPALNGSKGKDHNPFTNSALIAGRGVKGGTVVGASKLLTRFETKDAMPCHIGVPYDFAKERLVNSLERATSYIFPENVVQTVIEIMGKSSELGIKKLISDPKTGEKRNATIPSLRSIIRG